jgi:hypothetical protein
MTASSYTAHSISYYYLQFLNTPPNLRSRASAAPLRRGRMMGLWSRDECSGSDVMAAQDLRAQS